jgi:hypothetical protein
MAELSTLGSVIKTAYEGVADTNAFTDAEKTKLTNIEAAADVTDATNVTAAGALMDSEVTNLAAVKAFDPTDYATAAQGSTADAALPADGSGEMTGDLVFAEAADHTSTPAAGKGYVWCKSTTPSTLIFTDDAGTDTTLGAGGGGGDFKADGTVDMTGEFRTDAGTFDSDVADGASAVAWSYDTAVSYATSGAKLANWKNNGTEVMSLGKAHTDGLILGPNATMNAAKLYSSGASAALELGRFGVGGANDKLVILGSNSSGSIHFGDITAAANTAIRFNSTGLTIGTADGSKPLAIGYNDATQRTYDFQADYNANRDRNGAHLRLLGGNGGATNRTGGDVLLEGGTATGTGTKGVVRMAGAHTVATLPGTPTVGMLARVTDADTPAVGSTVTGGGAAAALVWYNGSNWTVIGI